MSGADNLLQIAQLRGGYSEVDIIHGIEKFHGVVISADEKLVKPDAAIYRRLTDRFGLDPAQCLFVDDMPANVAGAQAVGWQGGGSGYRHGAAIMPCPLASPARAGAEMPLPPVGRFSCSPCRGRRASWPVRQSAW